MRNTIIAGALAGSMALICACGGNQKPQYIGCEGFAQGTTWHITYKAMKGENLKPQFDSILKAFDYSISTYNKESLLTKINDNQDVEVDDIIRTVFEESKWLWEVSDGMFDPTCRPIVNAWGFAKHKELRKPEQSELDSILQFVGMDKIDIKDKKIVKSDERMSLNFNANAQGYSVDLICDYLKDKGYTDYLVEVGGETRAIGVNAKGTPWRIGIDSPIDGSTPEDREINTVVPVSGKALCTSGDYRNFLEVDGVKYSHELNPKTGYPKDDSLLSVSILSEKAIDGDGLATAVMVLGLEKGRKLVDSLPNVEALFIYADKNGNFKSLKTNGFVTEEIE